MNLDNVTAELRPRVEWEAADFGVRMVRRDAGAIYKVWFAITIPMLALTLAGIYLTPYATAAILAYWWFEPLTDGPMLSIISRRLFGEKPDVRATLRDTVRLAWKNRIFLFTPYRLHFARSTAIPVTQLEGLGGPARRARAKVLNQRVFNHGMGVSAAYHHLFLALYIGIYLLVFAFIPVNYQDEAVQGWYANLWLDSTATASAIGLLLVYVAQTALHPWFVGAGFGLYINCRTRLEAWDIEVAFRRIVQRRNGIATALLLACLLPAAFSADPVRAQDVVAEDEVGSIEGYWYDEDFETALKATLEREELSTTESVERWRSTAEPEVPDEDLDLDWLQNFFEGVGKVVSFIVEFGLWLLVGALLLLLFVTRDRWLPYLQAAQGYTVSRPTIRLAGGELKPEEMPDDIPGEVQKLWQQGEHRRALSLLYRGSVFAAVMRHGVRLPQSATEGQCLRAVDGQAGSEPAAFFRLVVNEWIRCAYGFQQPADEAVLPLCRDWNRHFGELT